jgi:hypothetical protein
MHTIHRFLSKLYVTITYVRKNMDVNEYERSSNITLSHKFKQVNRAFIAVLHFKYLIQK